MYGCRNRLQPRHLFLGRLRLLGEVLGSSGEDFAFVLEQPPGQFERAVEVPLGDGREDVGGDFARAGRRLHIKLQEAVKVAQVLSLARRKQERALQGEIDAAGRRDRLTRGQNVFGTQDGSLIPDGDRHRFAADVPRGRTTAEAPQASKAGSGEASNARGERNASSRAPASMRVANEGLNAYSWKVVYESGLRQVFLELVERDSDMVVMRIPSENLARFLRNATDVASARHVTGRAPLLDMVA